MTLDEAFDICKNWLAESPEEYDCPAPMQGQDNQEVEGSLLGLDNAIVENLQRQKVIRITGLSAEIFVMKGGDDWEAKECRRWRSLQPPKY